MPKQNRTFGWTREIVKDLIALYESQCLLYTTTSSDYKNKIKRMEAIIFIKTHLIEKYPHECLNLTEDDIKKKIHILKTQYSKERALLQQYLSSGASSEAYISKLWCFDLLQFLHEGDPVVESETNLEETESVSDVNTEEMEGIIFEGSVEEYQDSFYPSTPTQPSGSSTPTRSRDSSHKSKQHNSLAVTSVLKSALDTLQEHKNKKPREDDEFDLFGKMIAAELRKVKDVNTVKE